MIKLYNSLSRRPEEFRPLNKNEVKMYTCGPTVYFYQHIGNFRTFSTGDFVARILKFNDYKVKYIMNFTDVGHLTDDADAGDDKLEMAATKEGKSVREIADFYIKDFLVAYEKLNLLNPYKFTRATEYIKEQIDMVKELEKGGYTYRTSQGIYFDTAKFEDYGRLSGLTADNVLEGARVEPDKEKKNPTDFALWKLSKEGESRWQEWNSPWGTGFPGWHIECSAMILKELGETIDIHIGGEDHKMIHHPNEIAQSESANATKFVNYWLHTAFLQVDDGKMSKSLNNIYTVSDIESKGFNPLALRYFYMTAHYRSPLNFTWAGLQSADNALAKLYAVISGYTHNDSARIRPNYYDDFLNAINDDINMPRAIAVLWDMLKADIPEEDKIVTALKFDEVLGLDLEDHIGYEIPQNILDLAKIRQSYRQNNIWDKADLIRKQIEEKGYTVEDQGSRFKLKRKFRF